MKPITAFQKMPPIPRDQFVIAFDLAVSAVDHGMPANSPETRSVNLDFGDSTIEKFSFTDCPMNRALFAAKDHFGPGDLFFNFSMRFMAFHDLLSANLLEDWLRSSEDIPGVQEIHPALLYAASEVKMTKRGNFSVKLLHNRARAIVENEDISFD